VGPSAQRLNWNTTDMIGELLAVSKQDLGTYRDQYMIAAEFNTTLVNAMYNSIPYHSAPVSINLATNTILKTLSPPDKDYTLQVTNHPLQNNLFNRLTAALTNLAFTTFVPSIFGLLVPIGLSLFAASFVVFPTEERLSQSKQLQLMTGVSSVTFWGISFLWDFVVMSLAICVMVLCIPIFESNGSFSGTDPATLGKCRLKSFSKYFVVLGWTFCSSKSFMKFQVQFCSFCLHTDIRPYPSPTWSVYLFHHHQEASHL
jgi:hypothetical protein